MPKTATNHTKDAKDAGNQAATATPPAAPAENTDPQLPFEPKLPARPFVDPHAVPQDALQGPPPPPTLKDVQKVYAAPAQQSTSNTLGNPTQNLQTFTIQDVAQFTKEGSFSTIASKDVHLFYVGRDNVHELLKYILSRVTVSLYLNMFGFDDSELNNIIMQKVLNPSITVLITLDQSQAGGVHEKALLEADQKYNLAAYGTHFAIGQSATHQISHTKGFVADGRVACEGSTNWSASGEGTFVVQGAPGGPGYKAQNNTQSVITDPDTLIRFQTELIAEHMIVTAAVRGGTVQGKISQPLSAEPTPASKAVHDSIQAATAPPTARKTAAKKTVATGNGTAKKAVKKTS